jgi:anti-sigma B factor antagonist
MEISRRHRGEATILDLSGRLQVSAGETELIELRSTFAELVEGGRVWVALCLAGVRSIDARGLGDLVFMLTTLRAHGGDLMLIAPTAVVKKMLAVTRLDRVFQIYDSELEASRRIGRGRPPTGLRENDFRSFMKSEAFP